MKVEPIIARGESPQARSDGTMNETLNVIRGTILPDGTLKLDEPTTLPAGKVEVTIRPVVEVAKAGNWWERMQRGRAELEASGHQFRTKEEIDADIEDMRDWDSRLDEIRHQLEEEHRRNELK
jgi:hypothetical protein